MLFSNITILLLVVLEPLSIWLIYLKMGTVFFAFIRLVGCFYFKEHLAGFSDTSPYNVYRDCEGASEKEKHIVWLNYTMKTSKCDNLFMVFYTTTINLGHFRNRK